MTGRPVSGSAKRAIHGKRCSRRRRNACLRFLPREGIHERREPQSRGGATAGPGEGQPGEEPGEVQEVLPEPNG